MCRTLLKPGTPYAKPNRRQARPHIGVRTNTGSCNPPREQCLPAELLCIVISLSASSSPQKWRFIVFAARVCIPLSPGECKYPPFMRQRPETGLPRRRLSPALIHPSAAWLTAPPPACSLTSRCCGFPGLYAGCCRRQIEDPFCVLS